MRYPVELERVGLTEGRGGERGENESWWGLQKSAPTPGKEEGKKQTPKEFGKRNQAKTVTHIYQGFETWASCGDGVVGGRGVQPQSYSVAPHGISRQLAHRHLTSGHWWDFSCPFPRGVRAASGI